MKSGGGGGGGGGRGGQIEPPLPGKTTFKKPSLIRVKIKHGQNIRESYKRPKTF